MPASAKSLADERDRKRGLNPADETLNDLNKQFNKLEREDKRTKLHSAVDKCDYRAGISHLWRLVKSLSGKQPHTSPNKGVQFADKTDLDSNGLGISEWKLPLRGRITYRHCRQPKLPNILYLSNTTSWRLMRRANNNNLDPKMIANKFAHQFTSPPIRLTGDKSKRKIKRQFH